MLGPADILVGGVLPGLVALVLRHVLLRGRVSDGLAWPIAVGVAFIVGQAALAAPLGSGVAGWAAGLPPAFERFVAPREASQWLPALVVAATVVALVTHAGRRGRYAAVVLGVVLAIGLPLRLLWGSVYTTSQWTAGETAAWIAGIGAALLAIGVLLARQTTEPSPGLKTLRDLMPGGVMIAVAVVLATSGSLSYARLAGAAAAALCGAALGGFRIPKDRLVGVKSAAPLTATLGGAMVLLGYFFAEVTAINALLLLAALAATALPTPAFAAKGWAGFAVRAAFCLVLAGAAAGSAGAAFAKAMQAEADNPYAGWSAE